MFVAPQTKQKMLFVKINYQLHFHELFSKKFVSKIAIGVNKENQTKIVMFA
jgi:hypothetical protein